MLNCILKPFIKQSAFLIIFLLVVTGAFAQTIDSSNYVQPFSKGSAFRTWSVGLSAGILMPFNEDYATAAIQPGYGGYVKKQILPTLGIQADFLAGRASGNNSTNGTYSSYLTSIDYAVDVSLNITLANIGWRHKKGVIQPYFTGGIGYMGYEPQLTTSGPVASRVSFPYKANGGNVQSYFVPVGAGLKINLSRDISLDMGYSVYFLNSDVFDGTVYGTRNDELYYAHIGFEIGLGNSKKPQLSTHNPVASMRTEYLMIEKKLIAKEESDKAQIDQLKAELALKNELINATNASLIKFTMDSDNDGVPDLYDKCPNTPAGTIIDGSGCPLNIKQAPPTKIYVTEQDKKVVKEAIDNLEFDFNKATIRPISFPSLDKVAQLLVEKNFGLKLAGYTDNRGTDAVNLKISKDRAAAIRTYLVRKGANASKIEATGYGKENPIADNNTEEGHQANRRVEFTLY